MHSDFNKICRLCLKFDVQLSHIFSKESPLFTNLCDTISKVTATPIFEGDSLPSQICSGCLSTLLDFFKFRELCRNSFSFLQNFNLKNKEDVSIIDYLARSNGELQGSIKEEQIISGEEGMETLTSELEPNITNSSEKETNISEIGTNPNEIQEEEVELKVDVRNIDKDAPVTIPDNAFQVLLNKYTDDVKVETEDSEIEPGTTEKENEDADVNINVCNLDPNVLVSVSEDAFQILGNNPIDHIEVDVDPADMLIERLVIKDEICDLEDSLNSNAEDLLLQNSRTSHNDSVTVTCFKIKPKPKRSKCKEDNLNISNQINNVIARLLKRASKKLNLSKRNSTGERKKSSVKRKPLLSDSIDSNNKLQGSKESKRRNSCHESMKRQSDNDPKLEKQINHSVAKIVKTKKQSTTSKWQSCNSVKSEKQKALKNNRKKFIDKKYKPTVLLSRLEDKNNEIVVD